MCLFLMCSCDNHDFELSEKDGFSKKILEIPTVNKFFGSKFTDARSQIFSFTRE